jgi:hypothetical protein
MFRRKQRQQENAALAEHLPAGWHNGTLAQVSIQRRRGKRTKRGFQPAGWDLIDTYSDQVIAEYNDETAPPPTKLPYNRTWAQPHLGRITGHGRTALAPTGSELGEMFQAIYTLCYNTTMEAMNLMAEAVPEHQYSEDGQPIAMLTISAYTKLPVSTTMSKKQAFCDEEPF